MVWPKEKTKMPTSSEAGLDVEGEGEMSLLKAEPGKTYVVKSINTGDQEMNAFLFHLGCYVGEPITLVSKKRSGCVVVIKDGRYNFDSLLSEAVLV